MKKRFDPGDLIGRKPAAELLGISTRTLDRLCAAGKIPEPLRYGQRCVLYSKRALRKYLEAAETKAA
jgi:excisionase family DNA binding protein